MLINNQGFFIVTPPRSGTHFLVDSISFLLKKHNKTFTKYDNDFWNHPTVKRNDSVIGTHCLIKDKKILEFAKERKVITTTRHPLGQALSILAMYRRGFDPDWEIKDQPLMENLSNCQPNSSEFLNFIKSNEFKNMRKITDDWKGLGIVVDFDKILNMDKEEYKKISKYIGIDFVPKNIEKSRKKYKDGMVFLGDPDLWRGVICQDIANEALKIFPEYDMTTYGNSSLDGNWIFDNALKI